MNVLREAIDHATLGWIKPELDAGLEQVRQEVEAFAEAGADPARMRLASSLLHQVQGSLKMIELYAPAMVASEMKAVADAVSEGRVPSSDEACAALMRGAMQLPDYLERLQGGHRDIPIVLMPLLNELRAIRGLKAVSEAAMFNPDLDRGMQALPGADALPAADAAAGASPWLAGLRDTLDAWNSGHEFDAGQLHRDLAALTRLTGNDEARRLFWVASEAAAAMRDGALAAGDSLRDVFASVEREGRHHFNAEGNALLPVSSLLEPTRQLLWQVSRSSASHPSLDRLRETFELDGRAGHSEDEVAHAQASITGRNRALLDTVAAAIKEDVLRIKDSLDLHLRTGRKDAAALAPQAEALGRVADTLGMLGLGMARDVIARQRSVLAALASGESPLSESALLDVAGALLYVDASLDDQVSRLGEEQASAQPADSEGALGSAEAQLLLDALVREAMANFSDARQGFVAFVETGWDHAQLAEVPRLLEEVSGALRMLEQDEPSRYLTGIRLYTETEMLGRKRIPGNQQLDTLADALSSLEYYLEALREQRSGREEILAITRQSLEALRYWPLPTQTESEETTSFVDHGDENAYEQWLSDVVRPVEQAPDAEPRMPEADPVVPVESMPVASFEPEAVSAPVVPVVETELVSPEQRPEIAARADAGVDATPAPAPAALTVEAGGFDLESDGIDDEIREIFLEEFGEEIDNLGQLMPEWRTQPDDLERLRPIRRVFHTLKGSGRLVGARVLGEFSWKVENMLNRVLDGTRPASPAVLALVGQACDALPALRGALDGRPFQLDLAGMEAVADRLAAGEEVFHQPAAAEVVPDGVADEVGEATTESTGATPGVAEAAAGTVPVSVDAVLLEILGVEVDGHLRTVQGWLDDPAAVAGVPTAALLRAVHTMNGAFAMAEVPEITDATTPAETWLKRLVAQGQSADAEGLAALAALTGEIRATVAGLKSEPQRVPAQDALAARFEALRDALPEAGAHPLAVVQDDPQPAAVEAVDLTAAEAERLEAERLEAERVEVDDEIGPARPLDIPGLDEDLLDVFIEEGHDLLDHGDGLAARLRADHADRDALVALQRDLHTLKGGARMAGIMSIGDLGHAVESLLESVAEDRVALTDDDLPLLEKALDRLHAMLGRVSRRRAIHPADALVSSLVRRARGEAIGEVAVADAQPITVELPALSEPVMSGDESGEQGARAPQEMVRIRADLLDRLVNYAGEVAIYRSRLEQQLGAFRGAMGEMEQTNARLRDQLRRLEIETEAQIIARYQREQETADPAFDPLELDRFSTLQQLSRALGESANDMSSLQGSLEDLTRQYETLLLQQSRVSTELQEGLMRTRMVPVETVLPRLRRVVRQAAGDAGKSAQFTLDGAHGELDRNVLDRMLGPLEHLLRNAVAHGIEAPQARAAAGKPESGEIRLMVRQEGSEVVLAVSDDGAGIDRAAVRRRGEERGLIAAGEDVSDAAIDNLILLPGFSTASELSQLSGRGVGLDVVDNEVRQIGGSLEIASNPGQGTRFTLHLPQKLAVTQAVFVRIGEDTFAVPVASVRGVSRIDREAYRSEGATHRYGGEDYAVHDLGVLLDRAPAQAEGQLQQPLLLVRAGDLRVAVGVDQIIGNREIVVKPTGPQIASVPGIFGATVMGDGRVMIILDIAPLARRHAARLAQGKATESAPVQAVDAERVPLVMVVDDSITMRKVTGRVLGRNGFEVALAKDGIDALERLEERVPDLMLLDIEMPRMDGYELAAEMKRHAHLRHVPIIMITSRTGDKHRQRAFDLGVNRYLGKPYQEPELLRNVNELLGLGRE